MNKVVVAQHGSDLSSRSTGRVLRERIENLSQTGPVELDFAGVSSISHSFADELLAVLIAEKGEEWFRTNIRAANYAAAIRFTLLDAIDHRLNKKKQAA